MNPRAPLSLLVLCLLAAPTFACAQASASHRGPRRAVASTSDLSAAVQIQVSAMKPGSTSLEVDDDRWSARGYDLKSLLAQIYDVDERRVEAGDGAADEARFDVTLPLHADVDDEDVRRALVSALQRHFGLAVAQEQRSMPVFVLSAPTGAGAGMHPHASISLGASGSGLPSQPGSITFVGKNCTGLPISDAIAVVATRMQEFSRSLEPDLSRLLVDETNLKGEYDFHVGSYANEQQLFDRMKQDLGLVVTPATRRISVVTVHATTALNAAL